MNEHTNISNKVSRCPNEMSDFYSASLRHTQRLCCNTARTNETQRDERIKERRRRSRWGGWAPRGWWSPRSARSRGTGPCWMPASDPRSSLNHRYLCRQNLGNGTHAIILIRLSSASSPLPSFSVSRPTRTDAPRLATP
jgi:hypothetical protein